MCIPVRHDCAMDRAHTLELLRKHKPTLSERFGVTRLALFGATARGTAGPASDIDVLVAFDGPATSARYFGVQFYLEDLLGRRADQVTEKRCASACGPTSNAMPSPYERDSWLYVEDTRTFCERVLECGSGATRTRYVLSSVRATHHDRSGSRCRPRSRQAAVTSRLAIPASRKDRRANRSPHQLRSPALASAPDVAWPVATATWPSRARAARRATRPGG